MCRSRSLQRRGARAARGARASALARGCAASPTIAATTRSLGISSNGASATTRPSRSTVTLRQTS